MGRDEGLGDSVGGELIEVGKGSVGRGEDDDMGVGELVGVVGIEKMEGGVGLEEIEMGEVGEVGEEKERYIEVRVVGVE